ncbi:MAG TPA: translocation/assembly module TamB domain-containing protein [Rubrivivax sp.]|nr:translocation/assembly module TamB domain-containing protein [Rubrivivax sp.]
MAQPTPTPSPAPSPAAPGAPPAVAAPRRRGPLRRLVFSFGFYLLGIAATLALLGAAVAWLLATESGAAWLLARVPGLQASGISGSLIGPFSAQRIELQLPGEEGEQGLRLAFQDLGWNSARLRPGSGSVWLRLAIEPLQASRIDLWPATGPSRSTDPPTDLLLPLGLDVDTLRVDEFHVDGLDTPLRQLHARLSLGADGGKLHRIDDLQLSWDRLRLSGHAQVDSGGAMPVQAAFALQQHAQADAARDWGATLTLTGPLAAPQLQAQLRAAAAPARSAQTLDLSATLRPFAAWPLAELQASARALDLSALHDAAPLTALNLDAQASTAGLDLPAEIQLSLDNGEAGRWNEGRLPLRTLALQLRARPDAPSELEIPSFSAELGSSRASAGRLSGSGQWNPSSWHADTHLAALRPALLDVRAPDMRLDGQLRLSGSGFGAADADSALVEARGELGGQLLGRGPAQPVQVRLDVRAQRLRIELRELLASSGTARATLSGRLTRPTPQAGWAARGQATLRDFDPLPWWPGREDSPWRQGPHRLNAKADVDLALPAQAAPAMQWLARLRGRAELNLEPSRLAGVPLAGSLALRTAADGRSSGELTLDADGNRVQADARLDSLSSDGRGDHWQLKAELASLKRLQPLWKLLFGGGADTQLAGRLSAEAQLDGRWPALASQGRLDGSELRFGAAQIKRASGRWTLGTRADAPLDVALELGTVSLGAPSAEQLKLQLKGTLAAHTLELGIESKALPPAWVETLQNAPPGTAAKRTLARLQLQGGALRAGSAEGPSGWRGKLERAELRGDHPDAPAWLSASETAFEVSWAGGPLRISADAGRAELLGAALGWSRIAWSAADAAAGKPEQLSADAELEPLDVAPLLARAQPAFGWGGDLRLRGHLKVTSAPRFSADVVIERAAGDLSVTDDAGTRTLGLSDLRFGLSAQDGAWSFSAGLAGTTLGHAAGAVVVRSTPTATWPAPTAPMDGVLELQIGDLGVWGPWLPPGWRLTGALHASAAIGGRFGAPEYTGELGGEGIGVRNVLQGVDVRDGELQIVLLGDSARIQKFAASAGKGRLSLAGDASLGASPRAELNLRLEQFQLLGRVDRRIVASGDATLKLARDTLALTGQFGVDEGLIDFSRSEAPGLSDDVQVMRGRSADWQTVDGPAEAPAPSELARRATLDLRVQLGEKLRIRGMGLDAGLRGELRLTAPQGRLRVDGSVRTVDGTYRAYRQRLNIERGVLSFNGPVGNPQLDIEATRPNLDVRVGVAVTGTVLVPRVRLFSEPEMSDAEKLSWLLRGRASEGPGSGDTALLQAAAMALISGDEPGALDRFFNVFGLDDLSVRQNDSANGGAVVSVGKQLTRNWYVGYERGLNATTGNWQLIYRIAQRFTIRAQSGESNSIELIWSWRWN